MQQYYIAIIAVWSLFGNLRGTFYLDDVRLVAARIDGATAVREEWEEGVPDVFALAQNYPNPFNSGTVIGFDLTQQGEVKLEIFNLLGQSVAVLAEGTRLAGRYAVHWDGRNEGGRMLASGLYFYRLQTPVGSQTRKLLLR